MNLAFALVASLASLEPTAGLDDVGWHLQEVGPGIWAGVAMPVEGGGPLCNVGIVDLGGAALVFDAGFSPKHGKALADAARALTGAPVAYLVDSHGHSDHTRGNAGFDRKVAVIGTAKIKEQIASEWPKDLAKLAADAKDDVTEARADVDAAAKSGNPWAIDEAKLWLTMHVTEAASAGDLAKPRLPNVFVNGELDLRGTRRTVRIIDLGGAHSSDDLALDVPDAGVVFAGDVVFAGMHPFIADGDVATWHRALATLTALAPKVVVPGHGDVSNASALVEMERWFTALQAAVDDVKASGKKPSEAKLPDAYASWHLRRFFFIDVGYLSSKK